GWGSPERSIDRPEQGQRSCLRNCKSPKWVCHYRVRKPPVTNSSVWVCSIRPVRAVLRSITYRPTCCSTWPPCVARLKPRSTVRRSRKRWLLTRSPKLSARPASGSPTAEALGRDLSDADHASRRLLRLGEEFDQPLGPQFDGQPLQVSASRLGRTAVVS